MKKVLLVEDHPLMRHGIKSLLNSSTNFTVTAEASHLNEAFELVANNNFDFAVIDISLPDGFGLSLLKQISQIKPHIKSVILTMHKEDPYLAKAVQLGAWGFLVKDMAPEMLIETLTKINLGEKIYLMSAEDSANTNLMSEADTKKLSERERIVLGLLYNGKTLTEIAQELAVNVKTIFTYRIRILKKLNLKTTEELRDKLKKNDPQLMKIMV